MPSRIHPSLILDAGAAAADAEIIAELSRKLEAIVRPHVTGRLKSETASNVTAALLDEAVLAASLVTDDETPIVAPSELRSKLEDAFRRGADVEEIDVQEQTALAAFVMANAWVEFLDLALGNRQSLLFGRDMFTSFDDRDLQRRLRESIASVPIHPEAVPDLMTHLGEKLFATSARIRLPRSLLLEKTVSGCMVSREGPHSASCISSPRTPPPSGTTK